MTARTATQPRAISLIRRVAPIAWATLSTSSEAITPRTKISCAGGIVWLAYLTSASLTTKHPIAPIIARIPARLALVLILIDVAFLGNAAFVHHFPGCEILRSLVPPDRAALLLLALELRLSFL